MKQEIKLVIKQHRQVQNGNWWRYYTVDQILINDWSSIRTEAHLCWYMYSRFGPGRYMCLAFQKGHEGFWKYWHGTLYSNGFFRNLNKDREVEKLKNEFARADSLEERERIQEDIQFTREINEEKTAPSRAACHGLIKFRPGILHDYSEEPNPL